MKISFVQLSVVIHQWENEKEIEKKFYELLNGIDIKNIEIKKVSDKGLVSYNLIYLYAKLYRKKDIEIFFKNLILKNLDEEELIKNINFDENYNIYFRIDKNELLIKDKVKVMYGDDVFHVRIGIDGYKKTKDSVMEFFINYIKELKSKINKVL